MENPTSVTSVVRRHRLVFRNTINEGQMQTLVEADLKRRVKVVSWEMGQTAHFTGLIPWGDRQVEAPQCLIEVVVYYQDLDD